MFKESITVLAVVVGLVATSAQAREEGHKDGGPKLEERFSQIDADGDGQVTAQELQAQGAARFAAADANGDGALTAEEMTGASQGKHKERLLKRFDTDGDGALSAAELEKVGEGKMGKRAAKRFEKLDADNSGSVTMEEMQVRMDPTKMIEKLDADSSGGLSMEEFSKARGHGKHKMKKQAD